MEGGAIAHDFRPFPEGGARSALRELTDACSGRIDAEFSIRLTKGFARYGTILTVTTGTTQDALRTNISFGLLESGTILLSEQVVKTFVGGPDAGSTTQRFSCSPLRWRAADGSGFASASISRPGRHRS